MYYFNHTNNLCKHLRVCYNCKFTIVGVNVEHAFCWWHDSVCYLSIVPRVSVSSRNSDDCTACWKMLYNSDLKGDRVCKCTKPFPVPKRNHSVLSHWDILQLSSEKVEYTLSITKWQKAFTLGHTSILKTKTENLKIFSKSKNATDVETD